MDANTSLFDTCDSCLLTSHQFYPALLVLPGFLAIFPQSMVLFVHAFSPLSEKTDILTLNLVFANALTSASAIFAFFSLKFVPRFYVYVWSHMFGLLCFGHTLAQAIVCGERYLAVEHPLAFLKYRPLRYRWAVIALAWGAVVLGICSLTVICNVDVKFIAIFLQFECVLLAVLTAMLTVSSLLILKKLARPPPGEKAAGCRDSTKTKAFVYILLVEVMLLLCYLPPVVFFLSDDALLRYTQSCSFYLYNLWFVEITSVLHCCKYLYDNNHWNRIYRASLGFFRLRPQ